MAFRGRGRGRGRGGFGSMEYAKPEPFVIFPEITLPAPKSIPNDPDLVVRHYKYENFWRNSPYHLGDGVLKRENESLDIERFSDALKPKSKSIKSGSFYDFLVLRPDNFPRDLLGDNRRERPVKKAKWSLDPDFKKLDVLEKLEDKVKADEMDKKGEGEGDEDVDPPEHESDESDNGDYGQNSDFDDDDDDYNQKDDGGYEETF